MAMLAARWRNEQHHDRTHPLRPYRIRDRPRLRVYAARVIVLVGGFATGYGLGAILDWLGWL